MLPAYRVTKVLHRDDRTVVYRAVRCVDDYPVILKVLGPRPPRPRDLERLRNEYETGRELHVAGAVRSLALESFEGVPALVLDDVGGQPLDRSLGSPLDVGQFLELACAIAAVLEKIHHAGVVHRDIKPENILVDTATGEAWITDFGLASRLARGPQANGRPELVEGSLPFMSPEQTGRMNRAIDSRSDLYSLGCTFFQMLTGRLPFDARDPLEWVHSHVARPAPSPSSLAAGVPDPLAAIVLRLMAKNAEDRYQTARGLRCDLERCREQWAAAGAIEAFTLGEDDASDRLQIPQRLYGRASEHAMLLAALQRMIGTGTPELYLVSGYSGVGKSSLVHELLRSITGVRGFFLSGKFDQYTRNIPYSTLGQAFRRLFQELLGESEERLATWRGRIGQALGPNGHLVAEVIPEIELVLGPQRPVPPLPPAEAQQRFQLVFHQLITAVARKEHPVVLFLDDLQWTDPASLKLLQHVLMHADTRYLLALGAYRDNEVDPLHPLLATLRNIQDAGVRITQRVLAALSLEDLTELVADTVQRSGQEVRPLARLLYGKTDGNAFFAIQFLTELAKEGLLTFDARERKWRWDIGGIQEKGYTANVVDLMVAKIARFPPSTCEALMLAASVGNTTDTQTLATIREQTADAAQRDLFPAVAEGLLLHSGDTYRFLHDRVQQAAYSRVPEDERPAVHLRIGRLLLRATPPDEIEERVFEIANQLNLGRSLLAPEERIRVAELDLAAGRKAMAAAAYATATNYYSTGAWLLSPEGWSTRYELAFPLHLEWAQCEFLSGNRDEAEREIALLRQHAKGAKDIAAVACAEIHLCTIRDDTDGAVAVALACLRRFGIDWPAHPSWDASLREYEALQQSLGGTSIQDLLDLPAMKAPEAEAITDILITVMPAALYTDLNLVCLLGCKSANLCLQYGNAEGSSTGYVILGMVLAYCFDKYPEAYEFGKLGRDLVDRRGHQADRAKVYVNSAQTNQWKQPLRTTRELLERAFDVAREAGVITYACYACDNRTTLLLVAGFPLPEVQRECEAALTFVRKASYHMIEAIIISQLRLILNLRGATAHFSTFSDDRFDERAFEEGLEVNRGSMMIAICWHYVRKLQARFLSGDYKEALDAARRAEELLWTSPSFMEVPEYYFFHALSLAAFYDKARPEERPGMLVALDADRERFRIWAESCPENFLHKHALVTAERARIAGDEAEAMRQYERAIQSARADGFVQNEGIAYELAARFYGARGFAAIADLYLREARLRYLSWGADGKVKQIDGLFPNLLEQRTIAPTTTFAVRAEQLDLSSVVKASQAISKEVVWDRLVRTLLEVVLEQGGAQRGCLIFARDGDLIVDAEAMFDEGGVTTSVLMEVPLDASLAAVSVVHFVRRSKERVILDDAAVAGPFTTDEYISSRKLRSLLCLPILRQTEVVGVLYLENNLLSGAFTPTRLAALELIAAQAAISLEISMLLGREQARRMTAEADERHAAFLGEATALLSESLDDEEQLARLGRSCVASLADWCVVDLLTEGGEIRRAGSVHADPAKALLLRELQRRYPPRVDSRHPAARVLRTGEPLLLSELDDALLRAHAEDDEHYRLIRELGTRTAMAAPLVARQRALGCITVVSGAPDRRYGPADLELLKELARRAAIAIDNARLYRTAQEAIQARDEFLSVASHELRTPLTSLLFAIEGLERRLERGMDRERAGKALARSVRQIKRLGGLVDTLLDVTRIQAGRLELDRREVDLRTVVLDIATQMADELARSGSVLAVDAERAVVGPWDGLRLEQVVTNLLTNAMKFGERKPIEITVMADGDAARLSVTDHGIGISPEVQAQLFERFARGVSVRHYGGLGLGLFITRMIVEAHAGRIHVTSEVGRGSTFTVELPLTPIGTPVPGSPHGSAQASMISTRLPAAEH